MGKTGRKEKLENLWIPKEALTKNKQDGIQYRQAEQIYTCERTRFRNKEILHKSSRVCCFYFNTSSGAIVNKTTALGFTPIFNAVRLLSESISQIPLQVCMGKNWEERKLKEFREDEDKQQWN